jgi:hypothetical protein
MRTTNIYALHICFKAGSWAESNFPDNLINHRQGPRDSGLCFFKWNYFLMIANRGKSCYLLRY